MVISIDETHDASRRSWVESANGHPEFPLQNLPFGVFSPPGGGKRGGVAIGDEILDLAAIVDAGLFEGMALAAARAASGDTLNPWMALAPHARLALRKRLSELLWSAGRDRKAMEALRRSVLYPSSACVLHLPASIGDYTDFFAGIHHATNSGRIAQRPLAPNYLYVPIAYHGRSSSVRVSTAQVRRPAGQRLGKSGAEPTYGPSQKLDYEYELGIWVGAGNALGEPIPIEQASSHVVGLCLLNDWSARDVQGWESVPLGPFLAKNFSTTVSPWIVTVEALAPFRVEQAQRAKSDPKPLPYLWNDHDQAAGALHCRLEAYLSTPGLRNQNLGLHPLSRASATDLYWTFAQLIAHHTCNGCNLNPGDLLGSGTVSGPTESGCGCLFELTFNGTKPIRLASGEERTFLENGDEVIFRAHCERHGFVPIGFGECRGKIVGGANEPKSELPPIAPGDEAVSEIF